MVAVVTRWFGGTLLGAGGLVRAYGDAVRAGLDAAGVRRRVLSPSGTTSRSATPTQDGSRATCGGAASSVLERRLRRARRRCGSRSRPRPTSTALLAELTGGTVHAEPAGRAWVDQ